MIETQTPEKIHIAISGRLANGLTYIDALVEYAKNNNLEVETVAEIVKKSPIIKEKLREEAIQMKLMKRDKNAARICE